MKNVFLPGLLATALILTHPAVLAQPIIREQVGVRRSVRIDEKTRIIDKSTGKNLSYQEYRNLISKDPYGYHLEPIIDEYGQPSTYSIRPTTPEERETHSFRSISSAPKLKVGDPLPPFVMKGVDNTVYRSEELKGRVVVLSFWISFNRPFWGPQQAKPLTEALEPYQSATGPVSLGIFQVSKEAVVEKLANEILPFVAIPDAYGFHQRYQVAAIPSFIVLDRSGKVAAVIDGQQYDELKAVLKSVNQ